MNFEKESKRDLASVIKGMKNDTIPEFFRVTSLAYALQGELQELWQYLHERELPQDHPILQVKLLRPDAKVPTKGSEGAIGWDLYALPGDDVEKRANTLYLPNHNRRLVSTGVSVAIPPGYYGRVAPRSGLAVKMGIDIMAGVIDEDYRGEIMILTYNTGHEVVRHDLSKPIAQLILERADKGTVMVVDELPSTERGEKGFGSSDKKEPLCQHDNTQSSNYGVCSACGQITR